MLGRVGDHEVRSRFTGWLMGLLAVQGERVTTASPWPGCASRLTGNGCA